MRQYWLVIAFFDAIPVAEREVGVESAKKCNMGADNYSSASSRLVTLQNRKQLLEEMIAQKNLELRELCMQEAQITSVMPPEVPLEPGETLPVPRKKVGTVFEFPQNLISKVSGEKESISVLETEIQLQRSILEDASRLVNDASTVKEKRKNTLIYEQTKHSLKDMEEKLENLRLQMYGSHPAISQKQKKKPRPPFKFDVASFKNNNFGTLAGGEDMNRAYMMHQYQYQHEGNQIFEAEQNYIQNRHPAMSYAVDPNAHRMSYMRQDYTSYTLERVPMPNQRSASAYLYPNPNPQPYYSQTLPLNPHLLASPQLHYQNQIGTSQPNLNYVSPNHHIPLSHRMSSPPVTQHIYNHIQNMNRRSPIRAKSDSDSRKSMIVDNGYPIEPYNYPYHEKMYAIEPETVRNHSPIYHPEPDSISGLGGYWVKNENNESIWVSTMTPPHGHWTRDKRFGSLDRRKEKFAHKHERKNTIVTLSPPEQHVIHPQPMTPVAPRAAVSHPQLVRTQSLGSVGAQTVDLYPHDDTSSYDSDGQSFKERYSRKSKPKGWCETALDGPVTEIHPEPETPPHYPPRSFPSPQTPKLLEIPAESNPSPSVIEAAELFNNNLNDLPRNCTIVQAGQYKPYREVTKPFEMEDFYKYSTKFREKKAMEAKREPEGEVRAAPDGSEYDSELPAVQKSIYQPLQPMKCQPFGPPK